MQQTPQIYPLIRKCSFVSIVDAAMYIAGCISVFWELLMKDGVPNVGKSSFFKLEPGGVDNGFLDAW
jgi:hypothetical protein